MSNCLWIVSLPWLISSTTRKGQWVRSWSETKYKMVATDLSCFTKYKHVQFVNTKPSRISRKMWNEKSLSKFNVKQFKSNIQDLNCWALVLTPPDWWWALSTCNSPVSLHPHTVPEVSLTLKTWRGRATKNCTHKKKQTTKWTRELNKMLATKLNTIWQ